MSSGPLTAHVEGVYGVQWLLKNLITEFGTVAHPPLWFQHGDVQVETLLPPVLLRNKIKIQGLGIQIQFMRTYSIR
jgi:hypothetical protein